MLKISYAGCLGLSPAILAQFTLEMRVTAQNCEKKSLKPAILGVKGHSRSSMLTFLKRSSAVLVVISSMSVPFWNHFFTCDYLLHLRPKFGCLNIYNFVVIIPAIEEKVLILE